jgi:hypothetical protein
MIGLLRFKRYPPHRIPLVVVSSSKQVLRPIFISNDDIDALPPVVIGFSRLSKIAVKPDPSALCSPFSSQFRWYRDGASSYQSPILLA